jgi:hypothetical protein
MTIYSPELIENMRAALDEAMTKIPVDQVTPELKAQLADFILRVAAEGQITYNGLLVAAADKIQTILSILT